MSCSLSLTLSLLLSMVFILMCKKGDKRVNTRVWIHSMQKKKMGGDEKQAGKAWIHHLKCIFICHCSIIEKSKIQTVIDGYIHSFIHVVIVIIITKVFGLTVHTCMLNVLTHTHTHTLMIHDTHICLRLKSGIEKQDNKKEKERKGKERKIGNITLKILYE